MRKIYNNIQLCSEKKPQGQYYFEKQNWIESCCDNVGLELPLDFQWKVVFIFFSWNCYKKSERLFK